MAYPFPSPSSPVFEELEAFQVHHWPIVRAYADRLGLVALINRLVPTEMDADAGTIVLGMVIDTLSGRSPLYHLERFFETQDRLLLLGQDVEAKVFNDDAVGRVLERLFEVGTQKIYSELTLTAVQQFALPTEHVHYDTTSVSLYGDYPMAPEAEPPFQITYGPSKDHRPDLKQFIVSLLCVGGNVPILGKLEDGNASDKRLNNGILSEISAHMARYGVAPEAFIYVADAALISPDNLARLSDQQRFISRLPATYNEHDRVIQDVLAQGQWVEVGRLAETVPTKNRPGAVYKIVDAEVTLYGQRYRAVVVHSSSHDRRRQKRLERELKASQARLQARIKELTNATYHCEADAQAAAEKACQEKTAYHALEVSVEARPRYAPGRPKSDGTRTLKAMHYGLRAELREDSAAIAQRREAAGCFVLLTNVAKDGPDGYSGQQILSTYKEQHGVEKNFGFLKDDQIVNALFLKTPERLEALGLILLISLLIWRLMEHEMRTYLAQTQTYLPGWDNQPTQRPTAYMVTMKFKGLLILKHGAHRRLATPLSTAQQAFLQALGVKSSIFIQVPPPDD